MARDLESVGGQADKLLDDLDHLIGAIGKAYPDGTGGEEILKWLKPLRDGDGSGHGSIKEFGDNYRQLSTAADGFGDQLQGAKLNFYIAGGWLIGELAWAAATGPFAPESEAAVFASARIAFRKLGQLFADRIAELVESRITNALLREVLTKAIYEIGKGAVISTIQATTQELLVQSIQNMDGHGHGFDLGAIGKNALVAGLSGGAGGAIGLGAHHILPSEAGGGFKGAFSGMLTGAAAGAGGAGAGWLANGLVNGDWSFDPRSLTGGAFAGAGPSGLHGYNGESPHAGAPMGSERGDGSVRAPSETSTKVDVPEQPGTTSDGRTANVDAPGNGQTTPGDSGAGQHGSPGETNANGQHGTTGDTSANGQHATTGDPNGNGQHGAPGDTSPNGQHTTGDPSANGQHATGGDPNGNGQHGNTGDSSGGGDNPHGQQSGGPSLHAASAPEATATDTAPPAHDQSSDHSDDSQRSDNNGLFTSDSRRAPADPNVQDTGGATDSGAHRASDTHSVGDSSAGDTTRADASGTPEHRAGDATSAIDPTGRAHDTGMDARTTESTADHTSEASRDANSTTATNFSNENSTRPIGEPGKSADTSTSNSETRSPAADPAKVAAPRDLPRGTTDGSIPKPADGSAPRATDGTAPKPTDGGSPRTPDSRAGVGLDRATRPDAPVQAHRTGVEPTVRQADSNTGNHEQPVTADAPNDFLNLSGDTTREPVEPTATTHDRADQSGDRVGRPGDHTDRPGDRTVRPGEQADRPGDHAARSRDNDGPADDRGGLPGDHRVSPDDRAGSPGEHPDGVAIFPLPVDTPPHARPDAREYAPAAAGPVGDFHGNNRGSGELTLTDVHGQIQEGLRIMTPEGMSWNPEKGHFVLSDGRVVRIEVGETSNRNVAEFRPSADGYDVRLSKHARNEDVVRALAHELAEIRLSQDPDILIDPHDDRPTRMSTQLGGRFAELRTLTTQIDHATMNPARAEQLPRLRHDLHDLMDHLGFNDSEHAPTVERLLAEHAPDLAHRLQLEAEGVLAERPTFDQHLTEDEFQHAAEQHLDRLHELMTGDHAEDLLRAEQQGLNGRMREELSRRVFEPIFEEEARAPRKQVPGLLPALDPVNAAINHPTLRGHEQAAAIHRAIDAFHDGMPQSARDALGPERFARMHAAADAFATAPDRVTGVIDHATGRMTIGGEQTTLADFLHGIDRANRGATDNNLTVEYTVILHDAVDGLSTVEVLPRPQPQHRLPLEQYRFGDDNHPIDHQPRPSAPAAAAGGHTIDVGVGRGAFAVEMTPASDKAGGGLIIKTELTDAAIGGQRRRDLGILDAGPLMEPGSVMVYGDLLGNGHLLGGDIARVFINNVSAKLPDEAYHPIAEHLSKIMAPGGQIEIQWDMKPEKPGGEEGDRKHILGTKLWEAMEAPYPDGGSPFKLVERKEFPHPGNPDYYYTIDAGSSNELPHERMAGFSPPQPEHRWIMVYDPDSTATHGVSEHEGASLPHDQDTDHGNASPIGDFHGDAREGAENLQPEFVLDQIRDNLGLITPEGVAWNRDEHHFLLPGDGGTVKVTVGTTSDGNVAEFHARADGSGYDVVLSERARNEDVVRALAHELAEIRLSQDPNILIDPHDDRPSTMTPHLGGRFAEMRVLEAHIDRASADPARAHELPRLRQDLRDLAEHLGMNDSDHAATVRDLLTRHDPEVAQRFKLEELGLHKHRPIFDTHLTEDTFEHSSAEHLNQLEHSLSGDRVADVVRAEQLALDGRMREEMARRVFDPLFDNSTRAARKTVDIEYLLNALDPLNAAINDPTLSPGDRAEAMKMAIARFRDDMPEKFHEAIGTQVFHDMYDAADRVASGMDRINAVMDHATGVLVIDGEATNLGDFLRQVDSANRGTGENGLNVEYTVVVHDAVDGKSAVEVLSRPRPQHRLPLDQNIFGENNTRIQHERLPATGVEGHTIDIGVGRSAFAVEMTPAADRAGRGLIIKTELASEFPIKGQRRRDLGILDPGPLTEPGTVMVFGDLLTQGNILSAAPTGEVARIFINNVSADLPEHVYRDIAARLPETLAPGGRVEVQWDMKPEKLGGEEGDRHHILGTKLWEAIEWHYRDAENPFRQTGETFPPPGNENYDYTIDAGASNKLNTKVMATYNPPLPEHRMVITYDPHSTGEQGYSTPEAPHTETPHPETTRTETPSTEHGTASPVGEFRGDARPEGAEPLTRENVVDKVEGNLRLIQPEDVVWNPEASRFEMHHDGRTLDITVDVGPTRDNAVAEFTWRTDESGRVTGYDIQVSPHARDEDVVRAVAHELAEIRLEQDDHVLTDRTDDRPTRLTSHLGGRFAELRVLVDQIGEGVAARVKPHLLAPLRRDLIDLMHHLGLHDPEHAPTVERLLAQHDPDLARLIDQTRLPDPGVLRPGPVDHDATPTEHDLGRIRQLRELAEGAQAGHDPATRREALSLVERLGLREGTPGAADRRALVAEYLTEHARGHVEDLLADVGRRETELPTADREYVETVRLERRAADALDYLSIPTHGAIMRTHMVYRAEMAEHLAHPQRAESGPLRLTDDPHVVQDPRTGERWFRWPPSTHEYPDHTPVPDIGLPTDPDHRLPIDPHQLHDEWQHLSPEERDAWHRADPFIGNRDGIPHADRDHYNRQTFDMLRHQAEQDMLRAQAEPETPEVLAERKRIQERLDILRDMWDNYLSLPTEEGMPAVHLAYIDEKLQYIYALGDPDTAQNVAVEVAGAFRRRSGVGYALETLAQVRQAALAIDPTAETSVILFGAYNNPNSLVQGMHSEHGEGGAAKLREFHDGLRATHQGPPANTTTIAHSYGGVTAGHAAGHGHELNTDTVVFIGAIGSGVTHVGDLRLTGVDPTEIGDHVFATMAEYDSLVLMPPTHGPLPSDPGYGARVFESGSQPTQTRLGWNPDDHGGKNYFSAAHDSYRILGMILTGNAHRLR
ncbi:alpha/beta hydrolase [Nocardia sp. NPDC059228]|uniref:alpha/beta hydrolase n=1 Tax=Nocardia sp. NPDC059228 TaxID=3346777 RepID=UPI00369159BB